MKVQVTQENLTKALTIASRIATTKASLPILNNVLLKTSDGRLLVAATNLEMASSNLIGAKVSKEGSITVPAKIISEYISNLPKGAVDLETDGTKLHIQSGQYTSTINSTPSDDFPELPTILEESSIHYNLDSSTFKQAVNQTVFAASADVTRPVLTGVYWSSVDNKLILAATDGYRLAERTLIDTKSELSVIVPAVTLHEVLRQLSDNITDIDILFDETQVRFRVGDTELTSRLIDGKYPDYRKLIPTSNEIKTKTSVIDFSRIAKIAGLFSRDIGSSVTIRVDEELQKIFIQSITSEIGENTSSIDADVNGSGQVSINSRYLTEVLGVLDSKEVKFYFSGKLAPCVIEPITKDSTYKHIIMPLKS